MAACIFESQGSVDKYIGDALHYRELPHTHVKGKAQKVEVFEIVP